MVTQNMTNSKRRKSKPHRLRAAMSWFRMTSKGGCRYKRGIPTRHRKLFKFDNPDKDNVILRLGITQKKALAAMGGEQFHWHDTSIRKQARSPNIGKQLNRDAEIAEREGVFNPKTIKDRRKRVLRGITLRRGQPNFRKRLLAAYGGRCVWRRTPRDHRSRTL